MIVGGGHDGHDVKVAPSISISHVDILLYNMEYILNVWLHE